MAAKALGQGLYLHLLPLVDPNQVKKAGCCVLITSCMQDKEPLHMVEIHGRGTAPTLSVPDLWLRLTLGSHWQCRRGVY